ncbi:MAG: helix-hairpin-helix domain-containing protein [Deltaproteobacteria bacterium]|nr:MAG: helix-hairpin-helix domain-containing protein [Deltaproteobacteria bacterium]
MIRRKSFVAALAALIAIALSSAALAAAPAPAKNVNTATAAELQTVKGVGEKTAAKIIAEREKSGPFASLEDMQSRVRGVGEKTVENFKAAGWVATSPGAPAAPAPAKKGK